MRWPGQGVPCIVNWDMLQALTALNKIHFEKGQSEILANLILMHFYGALLLMQGYYMQIQVVVEMYY